MKVLMINGSPNEKGCTYTALCEIAKELHHADIETEIIHIGRKAIAGCVGCRQCQLDGSGLCIFGIDGVNDVIEKAKSADGFVFGSPVHFASATGAVSAFLDRCFYAGKGAFAYKPGAAIASCRRGGSSATLDQLNKYFTISNMPIVPSQYWNMVHGNTPDEVVQDLEGMQTMRTLGKNMAWLLSCLAAGKQAGVQLPQREAAQRTNFIR